MKFDATALMYDVAIMSLLLVIGNILRAKVKFIQKCYIPASLIAGILGMIGGKYFLNIIPFSGQISTYAGVLICVVFASLMVGQKRSQGIKKMLDSVGDTFCCTVPCLSIQWGLGLLLAALFGATIFPGLHPAFGLMLGSGFDGGPGTAAAVGKALQDGLGWTEATSIGLTFATVGMLGGVFFGLILINYAARKKYTRQITEVGALPKEMRTGLVEEGEREPIGQETINSMSMDSLAWHFGLVCVAVGGGYLLTYLLGIWLPGISVPTFGLALICGAILNQVLKLGHMNRYVDRETVNRVGSCTTDYLVAFAVASINISVVVDYLWPLIVFSAIGFAMNFFWIFVVAKRMYRNFWFERGVYIFGMATGVMATSIILYRICDPNFKTSVLEDNGIAGIPTNLYDTFINVAFIPALVINGQWLLAVLLGTLLPLAILVFGMIRYGFKKTNGKCQREGEESAINYDNSEPLERSQKTA